MNISRHSLMDGLSYSLDIAGKNNLSHSKSTAYISILVFRELGMDEYESLGVYYAALLHDIGVSEEYIKGIGDYSDMRAHCEIGEKMLCKLPLPPQIPAYILYHHEFYNGSGAFGLVGDTVPKGAQVIAFASEFDDFFGRVSPLNCALYDRICNWIEGKKALFATDILNAFSSLIEREYFLLDYFNHETKFALTDRLHINDDVYYSTEDIKKFAVCFADVIDQRSPFTFNHSTGIATLAQKAAAYLGYDVETQDKMYIAGLLHDIGKLHVMPSILHKSDKLTVAERFEIKKHVYYTRKILERIKGFEEIVDLAANHHEKLNGTGYPYKLNGAQMSELEKVMAICDIYQALTEERPYRAKMPDEKAWGIIGEMAGNLELDIRLTEKVRRMLS